MKYLKLKYILGVLRLFRVKVLNSSHIQMNWTKTFFGKRIDIRISGDGEILLAKNGERIYFDNDCKLLASNGEIKIGSGCFFNTHCSLNSHQSIEIGEHCMFGSNVHIYDSDHRFDMPNLLFKHQGYKKGAVKIGSNVWIGTNTVITKGVSIGDNVVIGANSVVTKNIESNSVYGGNPVKKIKSIN